MLPPVLDHQKDVALSSLVAPLLSTYTLYACFHVRGTCFAVEREVEREEGELNYRGTRERQSWRKPLHFRVSLEGCGPFDLTKGECANRSRLLLAYARIAISGVILSKVAEERKWEEGAARNYTTGGRRRYRTTAIVVVETSLAL